MFTINYHAHAQTDKHLVTPILPFLPDTRVLSPTQPPTMREPEYRREYATGSSYAISAAPFWGQTGFSLTGEPWVFGQVEKHFVRARLAPIYVGGHAYHTVRNGTSEPVVIAPGQVALLTRTYQGSPGHFARWLVEFPDSESGEVTA